MSRLPRSFYARPTPIVARDLLGRRLVRVLDPGHLSASHGHLPTRDPAKKGAQRLAGRIVEVEAYAGAEDAASHASRGRTLRNAPMFGIPGHAYVYFIYGMHWMFNVVARQDGPGAVLLRALVPEEGLEVMRAHRGGQPDSLLTNGPARLAQALAIDSALNGVDLCTYPEIFIEWGAPVSDLVIACGPRVGVSGDEQARTRPWRFWIKSDM
jgi:DNA-3-methyladenine glycosylase